MGFVDCDGVRLMSRAPWGSSRWGSSGVTMIECEGCQGWYHITCLGISPAKSKQFTAEGATATFHCPRCCEQRGVNFPFEPRVTAPQIKRLPSVHKAEQHVRKVAKLRVRRQEAELLNACATRRPS